MRISSKTFYKVRRRNINENVYINKNNKNALIRDVLGKINQSNDVVVKKITNKEPVISGKLLS